MYAEEGQTQKLEVVRGLASVITYWPRVAGELVTAAAPTCVVYDPTGAQLATPAATVGADRQVTFTWTPAAELPCAEDYRYELAYTAGGVAKTDAVYFDLVRVGLACPIDDNQLEAVEPDLQKWLQARSMASAQRFIVRAWDDILGRIRSAGYRPGLLTDRHAFARAATERALVHVLTSLMRVPDDVWNRKRDIHQADYEAAWAALGSLKFEDTANPGPAVKSVISQPRWRR